jgi:all-trans-retinol 13,14-reductase
MIINPKHGKAGKTVVVVGSGLGGLTAAVALAQQGARVTVLEKQPRPGGYATSFSRKGYTFDVALHALPAGGPGELFERLVADLGLSGDVSFVKLDRPARMRLGASSYDIPMGYDAIFDACERYFPSERRGIAAFRSFVLRRGPAYADVLMTDRVRPGGIARFLPAIPEFLHLTSISADALLSRFVRNPACKAFLYQPAVFLALPMKGLPAINFFMMFSLLAGTGMYTIAGGGQALTNALVKRLKTLGGEIVTNEEALSIEIQSGRAVAAVTSAGRRLEADAFVANVNTNSLVESLVGRRFFPRAFLSHLSRLKPGMAVVQLHAGLSRSCADLGLDRTVTVAFPGPDIDAFIERQNALALPEIVSLVATDLSAARPAISAVCSAGSTNWMVLPEKQYTDTKAAVTAHILARLDEICPGLSSCCAVTDLATPRTFHSYTASPGGSIVGYDCSLGTHSHMRAISRLPIPNLHLANSWTDMFGGFMPAMRCGMRAARRIMEK